MIWSKIRKELYDRLDINLIGRLDYHITSYKNSTGFIGRAWITIDGKEFINFSNLETLNVFNSLSNSSVGTIYKSHNPIEDNERKDGNIMEKGEFSKYDFCETAWKFISLDIDEAIIHENAIIRALSVVDRRIGKRRLEVIKNNEKHPLVLKMLALRTNIN